MRKLTAVSFVSLDGVMQGPGEPDEDRDLGFEHGGWAVPHFDQATIDFIGAISGRADGLVLGRRTYDVFAATWPLAEADDPIGSKLNSMPKYVASRTKSEVGWTNSTLLSGDVPTAVRELKQVAGAELQVHGSIGLLQTLLQNDLVDEFHVFVFPVLIGSGNRLFGPGTAPVQLKLVDVTRFDGGVVGCTYARDGKLEYGAMGPETGNW